MCVVLWLNIYWCVRNYIPPSTFLSPYFLWKFWNQVVVMELPCIRFAFQFGIICRESIRPCEWLSIRRLVPCVQCYHKLTFIDILFDMYWSISFIWYSIAFLFMNISLVCNDAYISTSVIYFSSFYYFISFWGNFQALYLHFLQS